MLPLVPLIDAIPPVRPVITEVAPVRTETRGETTFLDFGKAAFGTITFRVAHPVEGTTVRVRLGEKLATDGTIDRHPGGSVAFTEVALVLQKGVHQYRVTLPTKPKAGVRLPADLGEVAPFRYAEIEGVRPERVRQLFYHAPFRDDAASFESSDPTLNAVWELCRHSMKMTSAFGVYIDGDRERLPYEADAYINMLSHYAVDLDPRVARATFDFLIEHPTWPTEWSLHMPMIAAVDYLATGDLSMARRHYQALQELLLMEKARPDGLLVAWAIVDWPAAERDGFNDGVRAPHDNRQIGPEVNSVVNAFYYRALRDMALLARALGEESDADRYERESIRVRRAFDLAFFDSERGRYIDGEGSKHASLHASMFPLAFGMVPDARKDEVSVFVASRGMACSVYGAQYLLESLFEADRDIEAVELMTARTQRSWWNMIALGSTVTLEAWDPEFKPNLDWNHGWGAAPGNVITRYVLGVQPTKPGYRELRIQPRLGGLKSAKGKVPTPHGPVEVDAHAGDAFRLRVRVPAGLRAEIRVPRGPQNRLRLDGKPIPAREEGRWWVLSGVSAGQHEIQSD